MKNYQKSIFKVFVLYCFFCPFYFIHAGQTFTESVQENTYRRAHRLCYVATYYGDMSSSFDRLMNQMSFRQAYIDEDGFRFREGVDAWLSIDRRSLGSAFADFGLRGGEERRHALANMNETDEFVNSNRFEDAIRDCAAERGLVFEDLLENMREAILRVDSRANWFARILQLYVAERIAGFAFQGVIKVFRILGSGVRAVTSRVPPQVSSFVSQTRGAQAVRRQAEFVRNNKARTALSVLGAPLLAVTTVGDGMPPVNQQDNTIYVTEEGVNKLTESFLGAMTPIDILWSRRWINSGDNSAQYRSMIEMLERLDFNVDRLDLDDIYDEIFTNHRDLAIRIDLYFIDYWFVNRQLNGLRANEGEYHPDILSLDIIERFFDFRRRQLENQDTSSERIVALELLDLTRDNEFLCPFSEFENSNFLDDNNTRPDLLCKIHLFYTMRRHNEELSPERAIILQELEAKLANL